MSLYNYFPVKNVLKSSFKKNDEKGLQHDNYKCSSKNDIDSDKSIQLAQNRADISSEQVDSNSEITAHKASSTVQKKVKNATKLKKAVENACEISPKPTPSKSNTEKIQPKTVKTRRKKENNSSNQYKSITTNVTLKQTLLNFEKRENPQNIMQVTKSPVEASHKASSNKTQQADTDLELITSKLSTLQIDLTKGLGQHAEINVNSFVTKRNEILENTTQENKDIESIISNLSSLQLEKEEDSLEPIKKSVQINEISHTESENISKQNTTANASLSSKLSSVQSSKTYQSNELDEEEDDNIECYNNEHFHYSVKVFEENTRTVLQSESFLFIDKEIQWWTKYTNLSSQSKHLFVRLYIRKFSWFKQDQLIKYIPNSEEFNECIEKLIESGHFLSASPGVIPLEDILKYLTLPELKEVIKDALYKQIKLTGTKPVLIASILKTVGKSPSSSKFGVTAKKAPSPLEVEIINVCLKVVGRLLTINKEAWKFFNLVNRVFTHYGERYEQHVISESLRSKIGNVRYMDYSISRSAKIFPSRKSLMDFDRSISFMKSISTTFYSSSTSSAKFQNLCKRVEPVLKFWRYALSLDYSKYQSSYFLRFTPAFVYTKLISIYYLPSLAKLKLYTEEVQILEELLNQTRFLQNDRGKWWSRLCLIQASHLSKEDENFRRLAYENCVNALQNTINNGIDSGSANEIYNRMIKLEKRLKIPKDECCNIRDPRPQKPPVITFYGTAASTKANSQSAKPLWKIKATGKNVYTEEFALSYFTQQGWKGINSENEILTTLFALLFLDILFLPQPGAFETQFQTHPLDLGTEAFYLDRQFHIKARLKQVESGDFVDLIEAHYTEHFSQRTNVIGLSWGFKLKDLIEISDCIGGVALAKIFKLFCKDYFNYNSGMPDLCIWKPKEKICEFIEVKALSDTLSEKQKNWIDFLLQCGIRVKVCFLKDSNSEK